ncbi:MAG: HAD family hydrolase [Egibacteraceae bacterium]
MTVLRAVVFDLDDTLYPERAYVRSGFRAVSVWAETHLAIPAAEGLARLEQLFSSGVTSHTFDRWLACAGLDPGQHVAQLVEVYRAHEPDIEPYPGVPGLLERLAPRYRLGLVSDGYAAVQRRKLTALGLKRHFDSVVFSDDWGRRCWKPAPLPYRVTLERLAVQASESVYVADNPTKDFLGARRVGMRTVRLQDPRGIYGTLDPETADHAADVDITTLAALPATLQLL